MVTFEEFLRTDLDGLSRFARVLTGDRQQAHDTLAAVLERAQRSWGRVGELDHPTAYVRRMILTRFLDEKRGWSARMIRTTTSGSLPEVEVTGGVDRIDDRAQLQSLLAGLPPRQRAAIVLRYYLDLSDPDIATELGCSQGAVRTYISRGLAQLKVQSADQPEVRP